MRRLTTVVPRRLFSMNPRPQKSFGCNTLGRVILWPYRAGEPSTLDRAHRMDTFGRAGCISSSTKRDPPPFNRRKRDPLGGSARRLTRRDSQAWTEPTPAPLWCRICPMGGRPPSFSHPPRGSLAPCEGTNWPASAKRVPCGAGAVRPYFPARKPPARGLHTKMPRFAYSAKDWNSYSRPRFTRL
jgi:hypothetical protein